MVYGALSGAVFPANRDFAPATAPPAPSPPIGGGVEWCMVQTMPCGEDEIGAFIPWLLFLKALSLWLIQIKAG
ncbi:hypothetical protein [Snodgrassella alvi]|uniref:hypothetical protein n=1 Tax=Snodgrassella alvi TaxID=1196083 RepID=UPI0035142CB6